VRGEGRGAGSGVVHALADLISVRGMDNAQVPRYTYPTYRVGTRLAPVVGLLFSAGVSFLGSVMRPGSHFGDHRLLLQKGMWSYGSPLGVQTRTSIYLHTTIIYIYTCMCVCIICSCVLNTRLCLGVFISITDDHVDSRYLVIPHREAGSTARSKQQATRQPSKQQHLRVLKRILLIHQSV